MEVPSIFVIPEEVNPDRADKLLAECLPGKLSRSAIARLMGRGLVHVNGRPARASTELKPGDRVEIIGEAERVEPGRRETVPSFHILFEDEDIVVVDKPPGLIVHPGAGRSTGTLMDALVATRPQMIGVGEPGRWGIVHRLDRDTSGVMVIAKTTFAHSALSALFKQHAIHRVYLALVRGNPGTDEGVITAPVGRHVRDRKRISTSTTKPRPAVTRWRVRKRYGGLTLLEVMPGTGRTHQIRVHLASSGLPVAGDPVYGRQRGKTAGRDSLVNRVQSVLKRQALHASVLGFRHPRSQEHVEFSAALPPDMALALSMCEEAGEKG
jgi:23S rRNA pseudouridine1911/1915/1917 synthase